MSAAGAVLGEQQLGAGCLTKGFTVGVPSGEAGCMQAVHWSGEHTGSSQGVFVSVPAYRRPGCDHSGGLEARLHSLHGLDSGPSNHGATAAGPGSQRSRLRLVERGLHG